MFKKKKHEPKNRELLYSTDIFCLLLRKSVGYLKLKFNSDEGRRTIIAGKYQLSRCSTTYMLLKSFTCIDDTERWLDTKADYFRNVYDHVYRDTKKGISITIDSEYSVINPVRYRPSSITLLINGVKIESEVDKMISLAVFDTMKKMRSTMKELEVEQEKHQKLEYIKRAYDKEL